MAFSSLLLSWLGSLSLLQSALLLVSLAWIGWSLTRKSYNLPPGPRSLPLLGNLLDFRGRNQNEVIIQWKDKFGPIYHFRAVSQTAVVISDIDLLSDAYYASDHNFASKPVIHTFDRFSEGSNNIAFAPYSDALVFRRKLAMQALRQYLLGDHLQNRLHEALTPNIDLMLASNEPVDPHPYISNTIFNVIHGICFGSTLSFDDPKFKQILTMFDTTLQEGDFFEDIIPLLHYCPTQKYRVVMKDVDILLAYLRGHWNKMESNFQEDNISNLTENIIQAWRQANVEGSDKARHNFTETNGVQIISDVFLAGIDTTRHTLDWVVLVFATNPEIQEKAYLEVLDVVGDAVPGRAHRHQLPYTEAVIQEAMRLYPVIPFGLPHSTMTDTKLAGYDIPANTQILANHFAILRDPKHWEEPEKFWPERFLDDEGKGLGSKHKSWIPFSLGPRSCIGEFLARQELLYTTAAILQRIKVSLPEGQIADFSPQDKAFLHNAKPYKVVVTKRA